MEIIYVKEIPYSELKKIIFSEAMHTSKRDAHAIFQKLHNVEQLRNDPNLCINLDYFGDSEVDFIRSDISKSIHDKTEKITDELCILRFETLSGVNTRYDKMGAMSYMLDRIEECEENERYYVRII